MAIGNQPHHKASDMQPGSTPPDMRIRGLVPVNTAIHSFWDECKMPLFEISVVRQVGAFLGNRGDLGGSSGFQLRTLTLLALLNLICQGASTAWHRLLHTLSSSSASFQSCREREHEKLLQYTTLSCTKTSPRPPTEALRGDRGASASGEL